MIDIKQFVKKMLKKKGWGLTKFAEEINKVKKDAGITTLTGKQRIYEYFNTDIMPTYKTLILWEKALGLKDDTLCNMVNYSNTLRTKRELEEFKKRVRK